VLCALLERLGSVIPRDDLLAICWKNEKRPLVSDNALSVVARRLRQKLSGSGLRVRTSRGEGLVLENDDDDQR
jgi:DNA-binding response OmpR family regulator